MKTLRKWVFWRQLVWHHLESKKVIFEKIICNTVYEIHDTVFMTSEFPFEGTFWESSCQEFYNWLKDWFCIMKIIDLKMIYLFLTLSVLIFWNFSRKDKINYGLWLPVYKKYFKKLSIIRGFFQSLILRDWGVGVDCTTSAACPRYSWRVGILTKVRSAICQPHPSMSRSRCVRTKTFQRNALFLTASTCLLWTKIRKKVLSWIVYPDCFTQVLILNPTYVNIFPRTKFY